MRMTNIWKVCLFICFFKFLPIHAQDYFEQQRSHWLAKAEQFKPVLTETKKRPTRIVSLVEDKEAFQGWAVKEWDPLDSLYGQSFKKRKEVIVDFGEHLTGYFSLRVNAILRTPDAPLRFKLTFAEVPAELGTPFDPYPGELSRAWLQDEVVTLMEVPSVLKVARRLAFRYVKIELLASSQYYDFSIEDLECTAVTSASTMPNALKEGTSDLVRQIDNVGLATLRNCMQTVFEDGPKRDQRLWIGDLYLESLANNYSFKNYDLTKRCLYLLAGLSDERGYTHGTVFESPVPHPQESQFLMDYSFLYNCSLKDYVEATNDKETGNDLWPVAKRQLAILNTYLLNNGLIDYERANKEWWLFFDWKDGLHKQAALQGLAIYTLKNTYELARLLGKESELSNIPALIEKMANIAKLEFLNKKTGLIESGEDKQQSYASQIWMVLSGVLNKKESQLALRKIMAFDGAVYPGGPYLYHFLIQALIDADLKIEAKQTLEHYWGGMIAKGADTFWEVYDPNNDELSPYNFFPINSYCHAWSCTPVYFIRKYPEIFQN